MRHLPIFWALGFTAVTIGVHLALGREMSILIASVVLAMIGAVYAGFAVSDGRPRVIVVEVAVAVTFGAAAVCGLLVSPWFIVAATAAHGGWDLMHHRHANLAKVPGWYVRFCWLYDVLAAVALGVLWYSRGFVSA